MLAKGILIPLVTPVDEHGAVCEPSVAQLIEATRGATLGYIPCLTSGEGWRLSREQWRDMVRFTRKYAGERRVIAGIERPTTRDVVDYAREAEQLGIDAVMLTTPFGADVSQQEMLGHFEAVQDATALDLYIYNESTLSGNETSLDTLLAIADLPRVKGMKDSCEDDRCLVRLRDFQARGVAFYTGWENRLADCPETDGNVVSLSNLEPALCRDALLRADASLQADINQLCLQYNIFADDWYRHVKIELKRRGVIRSDRVLSQ